MTNQEQPQKPTILQVIPRLEAGGAEQTTVEINAALTSAGWRSLVVSSGGRYVRDIEVVGGQHIMMSVDTKNPVSIVRHGLSLATIVRDHQVSLLHVRSRAPAWSSLIAAQRTNVPWVTTYHGAYKAKTALKRWYNSSMIRADRVIANSTFTRDRVLEGFGAAFPALDSKMCVIPRGADLARFNPELITGERRQGLLSDWGLKPLENGLQPFLFLLPARMSEWKGHEVAIKAVKMVIGSGHQTDLRLIFLGGHRKNAEIADSGEDRSMTGSLEAGLQDMANNCGVGELVHFAGYCEDMPAAFSLADAVVVPSTRPEAFGRVAVEAGAMARPVIGTDHGGTRETIIDGQTGMLVAPGNADELAQAMAGIMTMTPHDREKLGNRARDHVSRHYETRVMCDATLNLYSELLGKLEMVTA